jgi:hypothetical protein
MPNAANALTTVAMPERPRPFPLARTVSGTATHVPDDAFQTDR